MNFTPICTQDYQVVFAENLAGVWCMCSPVNGPYGCVDLADGIEGGDKKQLCVAVR